MALQSKSALARARACIRIESEALTATARQLGPEFVTTARAVEATIAAGRKLIFTGIGKSAHIAQKLCGTFNSTGVSSCFLDATQALHGDLGLVEEGDLAILLSNSGQTEEIVRLLPVLRRFGVRIVSFAAALRRTDGRLAVIAEIKRRSPSAGDIKAGASSVDQAARYQAAGADALGFVFVPGTPRYISPDLAGEIVRELPPPATARHSMSR